MSISFFQRTPLGKMSDWMLNKSVSCESGLYAIPYSSFNINGLYESILKYAIHLDDTVLAVLSYTTDDIIYETKGLGNEICLRRSNIVYCGHYNDYMKNSEKAISMFKNEMFGLWTDSIFTVHAFIPVIPKR